MSGATWLPGVLVLVAGLLLGLTLAFRLRGQAETKGKGKGKGKGKKKTTTPDLDLRIRDLEARRDDLYSRIRAAEEDSVGGHEIAALEDAAALTLRELDRLTGGSTKGQRPKDQETAEATPAELEDSAQATTAAGGSTRSPLLVGFSFGAAMVAIVSLLVYWAGRDAQPTGPMGGSPMQTVGMEEPHEGQMEVPPEVAAQIAELQDRLVSEPEDWVARKQLALTYVAAGQFFEAFSQASQVMQQFPEDPDALLVHGIVRLTMGQADQAVDLLDQVLAQYPDHRQALIYRGLALYQAGKVESALDTWDMGLQLLGGSDPEIEELIRMAQSGASQPAGMMPADHPSGEEPDSVGEPESPVAAAASLAPDRDGFTVSIELSANAQVPPQATLFVFLRPEAGGPPVAARRIMAATFPLAITLGADDSMMGSELPATGTLVARLDTDGNVATSHATDLAAEALATKGQLTTLTLGQ